MNKIVKEGKIKQSRFIVVGAPTSGKSTFANELVRKSYCRMVQTDSLIDAFEEIFPALGITHHVDAPDIYLKSVEAFHPWIVRVIESLQENFVVEGYALDLEKLHSKFPDAQFFAFGFPNDTPKNHLTRVRKFDHHQWIDDCDDAYLLKYFARSIEQSRDLEKLCMELKVPFFNTSEAEDFRSEINRALEAAK